MKGVTLIRLIVGLIFVVHGYQKVKNNGKWVDYLDDFGIPDNLAKMVAYLELIAGVALILNVLTNLTAMVMSVFMAAAIFMVHRNKGFFVEKGGYEYALLILICCLAIALDTRKK